MWGCGGSHAAECAGFTLLLSVSHVVAQSGVGWAQEPRVLGSSPREDNTWMVVFW